MLWAEFGPMAHSLLTTGLDIPLQCGYSYFPNFISYRATKFSSFVTVKGLSLTPGPLYFLFPVLHVLLPDLSKICYFTLCRVSAQMLPLQKTFYIWYLWITV